MTPGELEDRLANVADTAEERRVLGATWGEAGYLAQRLPLADAQAVVRAAWVMVAATDAELRNTPTAPVLAAAAMILLEHATAVMEPHLSAPPDASGLAAG